MQENPQEYFISGFRCSKKFYIEIISHLDGHYYLYINGSMTDILIPRSIQNSGSFAFPHSLYELFQVRDALIFGKSKYNEMIIIGLFDKIKTTHPEEFI